MKEKCPSAILIIIGICNIVPFCARCGYALGHVKGAASNKNVGGWEIQLLSAVELFKNKPAAVHIWIIQDPGQQPTW